MKLIIALTIFFLALIGVFTSGHPLICFFVAFVDLLIISQWGTQAAYDQSTMFDGTLHREEWP